jgi:hypothetical protein
LIININIELRKGEIKMDRLELVLQRVNESLTYLSDKVKGCIVEMYVDQSEDEVVIILSSGSDRAQFCSLLYASGLFHQNDPVAVKVR